MPVDQKKNDEELMQMLRMGNTAGLDELFRRYYEELCISSLRILKDRKDAEDVVQEFFMSLWNKRNVLPEVDSVAPYFRRSVRNRSLNFLRDQKRIPSGDEDDMPILATSDSETSKELEAEELQVKIDRAINSLPERCRMVFVLSRFEGMKQKEIAEKLEISVKTVENQMGRAYRFLREVLSAGILFLFWWGLINGLSPQNDQLFNNLAL